MLYYICSYIREREAKFLLSRHEPSFESLAHESGRVYSFPETHSEFAVRLTPPLPLPPSPPRPLALPGLFAREKVSVSVLRYTLTRQKVKC